MNNQSNAIAFVILAVAIAAVFIANTMLVTTTQAFAVKKERLKEEAGGKGKKQLTRAEAAPIATSGDNIYITWWSNKTGNEEVMFRASTDNGATFGDKINLSNTTATDSDDAEIGSIWG